VSTEPQDVFIGISGISLPSASFDLGYGVKLSRTYAHAFSHPMLAVKPPQELGGSHPAPWIALRSFFGISPAGDSETVETELHLPPISALDTSPLDLAGWIVLLIRMKSNEWPEVRLASDKPFSESEQNDPVSLFGEVGRRSRKVHDDLSGTLEWVRRNWYSSVHLLKDQDFRFVAEAILTSQPKYSSEISLLMTWAALERLFSPSHAEIAFRVSAYIASFLEPRGPARHSLQKEIARLYGDRSTVAHGSDLKNQHAFERTNEIAHAVMVNIVEQRMVPTKEKLDTLLFA
jgi:hypothetical protein